MILGKTFSFKKWHYLSMDQTRKHVILGKTVSTEKWLLVFVYRWTKQDNNPSISRQKNFQTNYDTYFGDILYQTELYFKKICILSFYSRYRSFTGLTFVDFTDSYLVTSFLYYLAGIWEFYYNGSNAAKEITNIYIRVNFSFNQCI